MDHLYNNIKTFEGFFDFFKSKSNKINIKLICMKYGIKNYTINDDGSVDVDDYVHISNRGNNKKRISKLPLKFGNVTGDFLCSYNDLTSLEGSPHTVGGDFLCNNNKLTSLKGGPKKVGGFNCANNKLTSLEGAPTIVDNNFSCINNDIYSFEGLVKIGGSFYCEKNPIFTIWRNYFCPPVYVPQIQKWSNEKMELFNDLDMIRGYDYVFEEPKSFLRRTVLDDIKSPGIIIDRLNFFLEEIEHGVCLHGKIKSIPGYRNIN